VSGKSPGLSVVLMIYGDFAMRYGFCWAGTPLTAMVLFAPDYPIAFKKGLPQCGSPFHKL